MRGYLPTSWFSNDFASAHLRGIHPLIIFKMADVQGVILSHTHWLGPRHQHFDDESWCGSGYSSRPSVCLYSVLVASSESVNLQIKCSLPSKGLGRALGTFLCGCITQGRVRYEQVYPRHKVYFNVLFQIAKYIKLHKPQIYNDIKSLLPNK